MDNTEIWKDIPEFEGKYKISNWGHIRSFTKRKKGDYLVPSYHRDGYLRIHLIDKNGHPKNMLVHRLVALLFVPNPYFYTEINHIDGNKNNNYYENLEWCTRSQNVKHAFDTGLKVNRKGSNSHLAKSFYQFDRKGNLIQKWYSLVECSVYLASLDTKNGPACDIRKRLTATLHNRHKSCCGYLFSFEPTINYEEKIENRGQKKIIGVSIKDENDIISFDSFADAEGYITKDGCKLDKSLVCKCCQGKRKSHGGYIWRYKL